MLKSFFLLRDRNEDLRIEINKFLNSSYIKCDYKMISGNRECTIMSIMFGTVISTNDIFHFYF